MRANAFLVLAGLTAFPAPSAPLNQLIYGNDDRKDLYEITDPVLRSYAPAVGMLVGTSYIKEEGGQLEVSGGTLNQAKQSEFKKPLCPDVKFRNQIEPGSCSGFLVAQNILATAGHCVKGGIADTRVVMNFAVTSASQANAPRFKIRPDQIYSIRRIISTKYEPGQDRVGNAIESPQGRTEFMDYALLELDRSVTGATRFSLELDSETRSGDEVMLLGHPHGVPLKYAAGARVTVAGGIKSYANLDGFRGNSGSLVMNLRTRKVIGIYTTTALIPDFFYDAVRDCMSLTRAQDSFGGQVPEEGVVKFPDIFRTLDLASRRLLDGTTEPTSATGTCRLHTDTGFSYFYTQAGVEGADVRRLGEGAELEILDYPSISYTGKNYEGVRVRVVSNPDTAVAGGAQPGDDLWYYRILLKCQ